MYICNNCGKEITDKRKISKIDYEKKNGSKNCFCDNECFKEHRKKTSWKKCKCCLCGKEFIRKVREINGNTFCSHSCSAKVTNKERKGKYKVINKIQKRVCKCGAKFESNRYYKKCTSCRIKESKNNSLIINGKCETISKCNICGEKYIYSTTKNRYCSDKCKKKYLKEKMKYAQYRELCEFGFGIRTYIDEFDYDIVKKYGWYCTDKGKENYGGVSRDHIYSVMDGFKNKISPEIISHPANCQLIRQKDNSSKYDKSEITIDKLNEKIKYWNEKYGKYIKKILV
jgi:hypothetical protein